MESSSNKLNEKDPNSAASTNSNPEELMPNTKSLLSVNLKDLYFLLINNP